MFSKGLFVNGNALEDKGRNAHRHQHLSPATKRFEQTSLHLKALRRETFGPLLGKDQLKDILQVD